MPTTTYPTVAQVIANTRTTHKLTQAQLGEILNISKQAVSLLEMGRTEPDRKNIAEWYTSTHDVAHKLAVEIFAAQYLQTFIVPRQTARAN